MFPTLTNSSYWLCDPLVRGCLYNFRGFFAGLDKVLVAELYRIRSANLAYNLAIHARAMSIE